MGVDHLRSINNVVGGLVMSNTCGIMNAIGVIVISGILGWSVNLAIFICIYLILWPMILFLKDNHA